MSTESTIFTDTSTTTEAAPVVTTPKTTLPPEVAEFIGEGKKYSSEQVALASIPFAQKHINTLEQELHSIKEELNKRRTTEELLTELKSGYTQPTETPVRNEITQEQVAQLVSNAIEQKELKAKASSNIQSVIDTFIAKYGDKDKADVMYNTIAKDSGLTITDLNRLASTSPSAVLKLAGISNVTPSDFVTKPNSTVNTQALQPNDTSKLSARLTGTTTKDLVSAWKNAGVKIGKQV